MRKPLLRMPARLSDSTVYDAEAIRKRAAEESRALRDRIDRLASYTCHQDDEHGGPCVNHLRGSGCDCDLDEILAQLRSERLIS